MKVPKAGGSFNIPEDLMKEVRKSKNKSEESKNESPAYDSESIPEEKFKDTQKKHEDEDIKEKKVDIKKVLEDTAKDLCIELTDDDLWQMILNDTLTKRNITIIPGRLHASFKTLTLNDMKTIDTVMAEYMKTDILETGYKNLQTQHLLSHSLVELGKPGKVKQLGDTIQDRFDALGEMNTIVVNKISEKWNLFHFLVDQSIREEMNEKKS